MYFTLGPHLFDDILNLNMTNLFALCLIVTSLTAAGLWSPSPASQEDVIVKEGHRVVVVEYGDQAGQGQHNTKVSISSESKPLPNSLNIGSPSASPIEEDSERLSTRDVICDAFGKCKHKIASAVEKAKVMVSSETHDVGEAVVDAFDEAKETVSEKAHGMRESLENLSKEKARDLKEGAKKTLKEAKGRGEDVLEGAVEKGREVRQTAEKIEAGGNKLKGNIRVLLDRGVMLVNDSFRYLGSVESLKAAMDVLSLLGFSMALGMGVWTTFISSYVLAIALPRQQLAIVQSKIYPMYFRAMASSIGMTLFGHLFTHTKWHNYSIQGYLLVAALLMIFANSLCMEPRATKVMFERLKLEKEEGRGIEDITAQPRHVNDNPPAITTSTATQVVDREVIKSRIVGLNKRLKKLNSYSSLLNLLTLMALTWHLVYLSQRLRVTS